MTPLLFFFITHEIIYSSASWIFLKTVTFRIQRNLLLGSIEDVGVLYPIEVIEGCSEFIHLFLGDTLGISCKDLSLHFIDSSGNGGQEEFPSNTDML